MPPTEQAAAATDAYRRQLLNVRDQITRLVTLQLRGIDLDGDIDQQVQTWLTSATTAVELGQREAARLGDLYVQTYLAASGLGRETPAAVTDEHVGHDPFGKPLRRALEAAPAALLWRLGRGDGRPTAVASGISAAARTTRTSVLGAARSSQAAVMDTEPRVQGWRRVTASQPCGACLGAADGRIQSESDFEFHDSCRCTAEPVLVGVPERLRRPTGQEMFDRLSEDEQAALFTGRGGADKAALVRDRGVGALLDRRGGRITEAALTDL